ncbi:MAG TPA: hypothetical protein VKU19_37155 [Bryobacteraceae bacterium]|nr:hypothetical protein [Bryobacteraceae bacterium]
MQNYRFRCAWRAMILFSLIAVEAAGTQNDVCITSIGGLAGFPTQDGVVTGDPGWNGAVRLNLSGDLGSSTASNLQLGSDGSFVYLGFVVDAPAMSQYTRVMIGFSPGDGNTAHDWRLIIQPFDVALPADGTKNVPAHGVSYANDSSNWNDGTHDVVAAAGNWELDNIQIFKRDNNHWEMEIKIPIVAAASAAGFCFGCGGTTFRLWVDTFNTFLGGPDTTAEDVWPACATGTTPDTCATYIHSGAINKNSPPITSWGTGSLTPRGACTGISLGFSSLGVQDPTNSSNIVNNIRRFDPIAEATLADCQALPDVPDALHSGKNGPPNIFVVKPTNTDPTVTMQVSASFRLADFGIPGVDPAASMGTAIGLFQPLGFPVPAGCGLPPAPACNGVSQNPTIQTPIGPGATGNISSTTWALDYKQSCIFSKAAHFGLAGHQCVHVDLDSTDPNTRFLNKSTEVNMNFVPASTTRQAAVINGDQGPLPAGRSKHRFLLFLDLDQEGVLGNPPKQGVANTVPGAVQRSAQAGGQRMRDQELAAAARNALGGRTTNLFQWIARGYVYTGNKIIIDNHEFELVRRAGDFGYVAGHTGTIKGWNSQFRGKGLNALKNHSNLYSLEVAPGEKVPVETVITAEEPGTTVGPGGNRVAVFFDLGVAIPHGSFGNAVDPGVSFNGGLEFILNSHVSAEGIFGVHHFAGQVDGGINTYQYSGGLKTFLTTGSTRPFVRGGVGGYTFSPGTSHFGGYIGGGLLHNFNPHVGLEGAYTLHLVATPIVSTKFSSLQAGIRYVF